MKLFTEHPHSVGETYLQHLKHAFYFGGFMLLISFIIFIHGLLPFLFSTTSSSMILKISDELQRRKDTYITNNSK